MRAFAPLALGFMLSGCGWIADVTRGPTETLGNLLLSEEETRELGNQLAAQVRQKEEVLDDPAVQDCVDRIGRQLLAEVPDERKRFDYEFTVLEGEQVNAFAIPGGHIYVYEGLIAAADSEAELAGVLAHEIGHVTAGHVSDQLAAQVGLQTLQGLALGDDPGLVAGLASGIAAQGYLAAYSRDAEREADELGLGTLEEAGYDPQGMARFFGELARMGGEGQGPVQAFFATHPAPGERAERIRALAAERGYGSSGTPAVGCFDEIAGRVSR